MPTISTFEGPAWCSPIRRGRDYREPLSAQQLVENPVKAIQRPAHAINTILVVFPDHRLRIQLWCGYGSADIVYRCTTSIWLL